MNLTLDAGNTQTKIIVFDDTAPVFRKVVRRLKATDVSRITKRFDIEYIALSAVVSPDRQLIQSLKKFPRFINLSSNTLLPLINKYKTPATLGTDRVANAVAGAFLFPGKDVLIIDAGTCIKYDFVNKKNQYLGGSISPGIDMRFKALHAFTGKLPIVKYDRPKDFTGNSTATAIQSGVVTGATEEVMGMIRRYKQRYKGLKIILTGGDAFRFAGDLNLSIFAAADLVNMGLNEIIRYNASKQKRK
jgi:type III pantothenate kinase